MTLIFLLWLQEPLIGYIPHITKKDGGFETIIFVQNHSNLSQRITFRSFEENGSLIQDTGVDLAPRETYSPEAHFLLGTGASYAIAYGSSRVSVSTAIASADNAQVQTNLQAIKNLSRTYQILPIKTGGQAELWEGFAFVNPQEWPIVIHVSRNGKVIGSYDVGPGQKVVALAEESKGKGDQAYTLESSDPFVAMALGGVLQSSYLWQSQAMPDPTWPISQFTQEPFENLHKESYEINTISIQDELLTFELTFPVTCAFETKLFSSADFAESLPVQLNLTMTYQATGDVCGRALMDRTETFDLSEIAKKYQAEYGNSGSIQLNIFDFEGTKIEEILYTPFNP